jgi:hypothetical protein
MVKNYGPQNGEYSRATAGESVAHDADVREQAQVGVEEA